MTRMANDLGIDEYDLFPADYFELMGGVGFGGYVQLMRPKTIPHANIT